MSTLFSQRLILGLIVGSILGATLWPTINAVGIAMWGPRDIRCFQGVCVGSPTDSALQALSHISSSKGGVARIACGADMGNGDAERFFTVEDSFRRFCDHSEFAVVFTDTVFETILEFDDHHLSKISKNPIRRIDL